jgi:two-component system, LytTR family, sensor kinase
MEQHPAPEIDPALREAQIRERVQKLGDFYRNLMAYCIAIPIMVLVNGFLVPRSGPWSLVVAGIWGLILGVQALQTFVLRGWLSKNWEERKIEELMRREQEQGKR